MYKKHFFIYIVSEFVVKLTIISLVLNYVDRTTSSMSNPLSIILLLKSLQNKWTKTNNTGRVSAVVL